MRINILDEIAKKGNIFTFEDLIRSFNIQRETLWVLISRMEKKGWIERIERGKYLIIPLGNEKGKYTLNEFVIGSMLVKPYSISYWSALHYYGLTEQIPNTVFIQTTARKKKNEKIVMGVKYKIIKLKESKFFGIKNVWIDEEKVCVTEKEKTIIDCLDKPQYCGGIIEVMKALKSPEIRKEKLIEYSQKIGNSGVIRRLGYIFDCLDMKIKLPKVVTRNYLYFDPTMPHKGKKDAKWKLIINLDKKDIGELE